MWILIGKIHDEENWMHSLGYDYHHTEEQPYIYVSAIYSSITTLTTVGYGDIRAYN